MYNERNQNEVQVVRRAVPDCMSAPFASSSLSMPDVPKGGMVIKVSYAGACYSEGAVRRSGFRPRLPGFEISGTVYDMCNSLPNCNFMRGDNVILFPDEDMATSGYKEFIAVDDTQNVIQIPAKMPLEEAAMLPGGALTAYSAILKAKPHVEKLSEVKSCVNVLIVGAGGLGLWAVRLAQSVIGPENSRVRVFAADNSIDKLLTAQDHGCFDIIHWNEEDHEEYIVERTLDACRGGVDVVIDFVSSPRTMKRSLRVLNREGLILVGGNSLSEVSINLNSLAAKQQSIVGIPQGTLSQLQELVIFYSEGKVTPPVFEVFPVEDATQVFEDLAECRITGRAVLRFGNTNTNTNTNTTSAVDN